MERPNIFHRDIIQILINGLTDILVQSQLFCFDIIVNNIVLGDTFGLYLFFELYLSQVEIGRQFGHSGQEFVHSGNRFYEFVSLSTDVCHHIVFIGFFSREDIKTISTVSQGFTFANGLEHKRAHSTAEIVVEYTYNSVFGRVVCIRVAYPAGFGLYHFVIGKEYLIFGLLYLLELFFRSYFCKRCRHFMQRFQLSRELYKCRGSVVDDGLLYVVQVFDSIYQLFGCNRFYFGIRQSVVEFILCAIQSIGSECLHNGSTVGFGVGTRFGETGFESCQSLVVGFDVEYQVFVEFYGCLEVFLQSFDGNGGILFSDRDTET